MRFLTKRGYEFGEVSSAMQKAIRRGDTRLAGYWALELWASGYGNYFWKRLLTVSAEDCWEILTQEVKALHDGYALVNANVPAKQAKGRIFISKAVILLCAAKKKGLMTATDDTVLLRMTDASAARVLLREGADTFGPKIQTISVLGPALGSPGHGRWLSDGATAETGTPKNPRSRSPRSRAVRGLTAFASSC